MGIVLLYACICWVLSIKFSRVLERLLSSFNVHIWLGMLDALGLKNSQPYLLLAMSKLINGVWLALGCLFDEPTLPHNQTTSILSLFWSPNDKSLRYTPSYITLLQNTNCTSRVNFYAYIIDIVTYKHRPITDKGGLPSGPSQKVTSCTISQLSLYEVPPPDWESSSTYATAPSQAQLTLMKPILQ